MGHLPQSHALWSGLKWYCHREWLTTPAAVVTCKAPFSDKLLLSQFCGGNQSYGVPKILAVLTPNATNGYEPVRHLYLFTSALQPEIPGFSTNAARMEPEDVLLPIQLQTRDLSPSSGKRFILSEYLLSLQSRPTGSG